MKSSDKITNRTSTNSHSTRKLSSIEDWGPTNHVLNWHRKHNPNLDLWPWPSWAMVMTHTHAKGQGQKTIGLKKKWKQMDKTKMIALPPVLTRLVQKHSRAQEWKKPRCLEWLDHLSKIPNKRRLKNVGPIHHCEPFYIAVHQVSLLSHATL